MGGDDTHAASRSWTGDVAFLGGNVVLGGLAAGLIQSQRGGSFWDAFRGGALGGAVSYAGRRVAVEGFDGAGILGRELAAVGASFVRNAAEGDAVLDELVLPLGIVRLHLRKDSTHSGPLNARVKLDVPTALAVGYLALRRDADFDVGESLSAGVPVFYTRSGRVEESWFGYQAAGAIWLQGDPNDPDLDADVVDVFAHERVHVLQYDFLSWAIPADGLLTDRLPGGAWIARHLDLGVISVAWGLSNLLIPYDERPWEHEANFLSQVPAPG